MRFGNPHVAAVRLPTTARICSARSAERPTPERGAVRQTHVSGGPIGHHRGRGATMAQDTTSTEPVVVIDDTSIRPFHIDVPGDALADLRRRVETTRWPERETVADQSQGVPLATMRELARYWSTAYDWAPCEARLKALPNFVTQIDGLDIHFIHVRSQHEGALPIVVTHGWPGSIIEQLKIIGPLTDPTAYGASANDAFHIVIPSLPGYGYSGKPTTTGWD